ncbi:hypothetical protein Bcop_2001 [Bacteroides coprosuis DSM 18011]|uniref:Uncharacterized protein n=1 Tax=Bacteroides coprosuis DSM 18011 TaxID=679937 RepID=F3ZST5_9BACE|nr:hypothetical protein [Bacteroides coprosuis]EGJ72176.1 hypothetical protein Bcop_2001 [Bacteroides coprosuis DSM 18011]HJD92286.1 hypothetical protein [Bacteroides coprosuis]
MHKVVIIALCSLILLLSILLISSFHLEQDFRYVAILGFVLSTLMGKWILFKKDTNKTLHSNLLMGILLYLAFLGFIGTQSYTLVLQNKWAMLPFGNNLIVVGFAFFAVIIAITTFFDIDKNKHEKNNIHA